MALPLLATKRTINALRKADSIALRATARVGDKRGGNASAVDSYENYFAVIKKDDEYWIVNGADPDNVNAGSFTAGASNVTCISDQVIVLGAGVIYIRIFYTTEYDYEYDFAEVLPSVAGEIYITLATVSADGTIAQVWTDGAITYLNGSYWL